ncbi:MAG: DUF4149 domain-containing protein [Candidatus Methylomirabilia bacterium]
MKFLTIVSVSFWLGAMIFFSFLVAPTAFSVLDRASAGQLLNVLFPRYYLFGIGMGALALAGVVGRLVQSGGKEIPWGPLALLLLMLAMSGFSLLVLLPHLQALRQAMPGARPSGAFAQAHRLAVTLNLATILAGLALVAIDGLRRPWGLKIWLKRNR